MFLPMQAFLPKMGRITLLSTSLQLVSEHVTPHSNTDLSQGYLRVDKFDVLECVVPLAFLHSSIGNTLHWAPIGAVGNEFNFQTLALGSPTASRPNWRLKLL